MHPTLTMLFIKAEQRLLSVQAEREWQLEQALREHSRRSSPLTSLQRLCALVVPLLRGTLEPVMPATSRAARGLVVLQGAARR